MGASEQRVAGRGENEPGIKYNVTAQPSAYEQARVTANAAGGRGEWLRAGRGR